MAIKGGRDISNLRPSALKMANSAGEETETRTDDPFAYRSMTHQAFDLATLSAKNMGADSIMEARDQFVRSREQTTQVDPIYVIPETQSHSATIFERMSGREKDLAQLLGLQYGIPNATSFDDFSVPILSEIYMNHFHSIEQVEENLRRWETHVAKPGKITEDLELLLGEEFFWSRSEMFEEFLTIRAGDGRSHSGHGAYKQKIMVKNPKTGEEKPKMVADPKVNTTLDQIIAQSSYSREEFGAFSQQLIDDIVAPIIQYVTAVEKVLDDSMLTTEKKISAIRYFTDNFTLSPLDKLSFYGLNFLRGVHINPIEFMRGFYFTSQMDSPWVRKKVEDLYKFTMGWGECYAVDLNALKRFGLNLDELSTTSYDNILFNSLSPEKRIALFKELGIVIDLKEPVDAKTQADILKEAVHVGTQPDGKYYTHLYIREKDGPGVADDLAIVLSSVLPQLPHVAPINTEYDWLSRFIGGYFADFIDTADKSANHIVQGGQDSALGLMLNNRFKKLYANNIFCTALNLAKPFHECDLVDEDTLVDFVAASANIPGRKDLSEDSSYVPIHSSARYFLRKHRDFKGFDKDNNKLFGPATCTLRELLVWAQERHKSDGKPTYSVFKPSPIYGLEYAPQMPVGFNRAPFSEVKKALSAAVNMVSESHSRTQRLADFYQTISRLKVLN